MHSKDMIINNIKPDRIGLTNDLEHIDKDFNLTLFDFRYLMNLN